MEEALSEREGGREEGENWDGERGREREGGRKKGNRGKEGVNAGEREAK